MSTVHGNAGATTPQENSFPNEESLCEECGYSLQGLSPTATCPECGTPIEASHPKHRTGLLFQQKANFSTWCRTAWMVFIHPVRTFRVMSIGGSSKPDFEFQVAAVGVSGLICTAIWFTAGIRHAAGADLFVIPTFLLLTQIEALGVAYFSRRRGWRVPLSVSRRICAYCSVGWILGALILAKAGLLIHDGTVVDWMNLVPPGIPIWPEFLAGTGIFFATVLPFELLLYIAVRQVRYANPPLNTTAADGAGNGPAR